MSRFDRITTERIRTYKDISMAFCVVYVMRTYAPYSDGQIMRQSIPKPPIPPPPGQTPGHLTFWKNFGQIPRYIASLDGQMPRRLGLQRASNPPPSLTFGNKFCKIFSHYEFLFQLVVAPHFKQRHIPRYTYIKRQQQKNPRGIDKSNDPWMRRTC